MKLLTRQLKIAYKRRGLVSLPPGFYCGIMKPRPKLNSMNEIKELKELKGVIEFPVALYDDLYQESGSTAYSTMMGLFASVIEHCSTFVVLMDNKSYVGTQAIARAMLEAYVDILNIKTNGNFVNYLWAEYFNREKDLTKSKSKKKSLRDKRNNCFDLHREGATLGVLTISEKFNLADFKSEYRTFYPMLSANTHSGIFSLLIRVIEEGESSKLSKQALFKSKPSETERVSIFLMSDCLLNSCEIIAKGHDREALDAVEKFRELITIKSS
jgi:hypothetical protein